MPIPPKPKSRPDKVSFLRYLLMFRRDILSAQPQKLYNAKMAEFKTPFFRSFLINEPALIHEVLNERPLDFPKSDRIGAGLRPLLGNSVFVTNGEVWEKQRRIIDPAFERGNLRGAFPAMIDAADAAVKRMSGSNEVIEIEEQSSFAAADVIFRTLFSIPIESEIAKTVFLQFQRYQRAQPIVNLAAFLPKLFPKAWLRKDTRNAAKEIRDLIRQLTAERQTLISNSDAPDDLATKIMTTPDLETGETFSAEDMVDQVAIFFLAGHETSASALAWSLYLLATHPEWQSRLHDEAEGFDGSFASLSKLKLTRQVFREALRLYPPVPMMVREATKTEVFRNRKVPRGSMIVLSPWHLHRHERYWDDPDVFDPARWGQEESKQAHRSAHIPFSSGARVCPGAGFAMMEGVVMLTKLVKAYSFTADPDRIPVPVAHLTVRAKDGIWLKVQDRG
ncbi:MAG: cytochrome P450 [Litoreibacter sp.]